MGEPYRVSFYFRDLDLCMAILPAAPFVPREGEHVIEGPRTYEVKSVSYAFEDCGKPTQVFRARVILDIISNTSPEVNVAKTPES